MTRTTSSLQTATLDASLAEQWTLHHVLLDRLDRERAEDTPAPLSPRLVEVSHAFETLDAGERRFTTAQLEVIQSLLAEYAVSKRWADDRERLERLQDHIDDLLAQQHSAGTVAD
ncbi:hypothetical protein CV102_22450 [Natronococcus pandeyae]|uniref:Uncharacterized protein n=1 Tax=Natronococcus pandeyae TaxID=2055836 RepID=A0A8J8Q0X9_9EURY|nr:hypothetical protein [Natronococcus pandeyae]TYL36393.1 hypothetical protein CV102_22450 [Natronococcus pandeyae]